MYPLRIFITEYIVIPHYLIFNLVNSLYLYIEIQSGSRPPTHLKGIEFCDFCREIVFTIKVAMPDEIASSTFKLFFCKYFPYAASVFP